MQAQGPVCDLLYIAKALVALSACGTCLLSPPRKLRYNFLNPGSSATSYLHHTAQFNPNEIQVVYLRCTGDEVGVTYALAPKISSLGLSPKKKLVMILPRQPVTGTV